MYIGSKPADKVLTASDITDGVVSNAKLAQDIMSAETALTTEPASTDELLLSDAGTLKRIDYSLMSNRPAFLAKYGSTVSSISEASNVKMEGFDTELYDTDSTFASNRFTPAVAGKYYLYGAVSNYGASTISNQSAYLYKNGSLFANFQDVFDSAVIKANSTGTVRWSITDTADADDYYEVYFYQDNSGNNTYSIYGESATIYTFFGAYKLIGV